MVAAGDRCPVPVRKNAPHAAPSDRLRKQIAENVRALRTTGGHSQEDLAATAGVSVQMIRRLEAGSANPTIGTLEAVAVALERSVKDLVDAE